jgi:hypothetical protein
MERARLVRYVRIAVTAICLTACALLVALWARSAHTLDLFFHMSDARYVEVWSCSGKVSINVGQVMWHVATSDAQRERTRKSEEAIMEQELNRYRKSGYCPIPETGPLGFAWWNSSYFVFPYWFPALLTFSMAAATWARYSLRTLLIATTLVAVILGIIVAGE